MVEQAKQRTPVKKTFTGKIIGAIPKGIFWGFAFSVIYAFYLWNQQGFKVAVKYSDQAISNQQKFLQLKNWFYIEKMYISASTNLQKAMVSLNKNEQFNLGKEQLAKATKNMQSSWITKLVNRSFPSMKSIYEIGKKVGIIMYNSIIFVVLKLMEGLFFLPAIFLAIILGLIDGLFVGRNIREAEKDHESTFRFHKFIYYLPLLLTTTLTVHLVMPFEIAPILFCLVLMFLAFYYSSFASQRFKKKL